MGKPQSIYNNTNAFISSDADFLGIAKALMRKTRMKVVPLSIHQMSSLYDHNRADVKDVHKGKSNK